jgi:hypothetical protein
MPAFSEFISTLLLSVLRYVALLTPLWLPAILGLVFWHLWVLYVRARNLAAVEHILLEVRIPQELKKAPNAMELFLNALFQTGGEGTFIDRYWKGGTRPWFSLEMVSMEGQVRFFIWTRKSWKKIIESQIYAQYPGIEVYEVPDYASKVRFDPDRIGMWGCHFELTKADPYPIMTYVDYGMTKEIKEFEADKIDPITPVIEFLGSIGQGEQIWIQIIVRANKKEKHKAGTWFQKTDWREEGKEIIKELQKKSKPKEEGGKGEPLTKSDQEVIEAISKSFGKIAFDTGIRAIYVADKDKFNGTNIAGLTGSVRQYNSQTLNGFKPAKTTSFDYPWQDWRGSRLSKKKKEILKAYQKRGFFHPPFKSKHFVLTTEELATIFHFPGAMTQTPTFARISSKKGEPPANLPI